MIHLPARAWPVQGSHLTAADWQMCRDIGPCPALGLSFQHLEDWARLKAMGFTDVVIRLMHDWHSIPSPEAYHAQYKGYLDNLIAVGLRPGVTPLNEPNLELHNLGPTYIAGWLREWLKLFRQDFPDLEAVSPGLSPSTPDAGHWLNVLKPYLAEFDTIGVHYYWQSWNHLVAGREWTPEWLREQFPNHDQRITECGGADGTSRAWRRESYPGTFRFWNRLPYVRSYHPFIMSAEDRQWEQKGHTYDNAIVAILKDARQDRQSVNREPTMTQANIGGVPVLDLRGTLPRKSVYPTRSLAAINYLVIHHSAVNVDSTAKETARYHVEKLGWPGIGYHVLIHWDGSIEYCNNLTTASYNVAARNHEVVGVCLLGDWTSRFPGDKQMEAAGRVVLGLRTELKRTVPIVGHREIAVPGHGTACPGNVWYQWKPKLPLVVPALPPAFDPEVGYYAHWASLRVGNREEPRDLAAFTAHLRAVGKQREPYYYGWPVK